MSDKRDELAGVIASELNKTFKHQKVAYFLDEGNNPTDITDFISSFLNLIRILEGYNMLLDVPLSLTISNISSAPAFISDLSG